MLLDSLEIGALSGKKSLSGAVLLMSNICVTCSCTVSSFPFPCCPSLDHCRIGNYSTQSKNFRVFWLVVVFLVFFNLFSVWIEVKGFEFNIKPPLDL